MKTYVEKLKTYVGEKPPCFGDGESILTLLYEAYNEVNTTDDAKIKAEGRLRQEGVTTHESCDLCPVFL